MPQPTFAEMLADDTGNIRPEVADILMVPFPQMGQVDLQQQIQPVLRRRHQAGQGAGAFRHGVALFFFLLAVFFFAWHLVEEQEQRSDVPRNVAPEGYSSKDASVFKKFENEVVSAITDVQATEPKADIVGGNQSRQPDVEQTAPEHRNYFPRIETVPQEPKRKRFGSTFESKPAPIQWGAFSPPRRPNNGEVKRHNTAGFSKRESRPAGPPAIVIIRVRPDRAQATREYRPNVGSNRAMIDPYYYQARQFDSGYFPRQWMDYPRARMSPPPMWGYQVSQCRPYYFHRY